MRILNAQNKTVGEVKQTEKPLYFSFNNQKPFAASSISHACKMVCEKLGEGHFFHLFSI